MFAAGFTPIALIGDVWVMAVALFVAGLAISPTIIAGYALIERLVPAHLLTEGMTWVSTAVGFGVALGAWAAGGSPTPTALPTPTSSPSDAPCWPWPSGSGLGVAAHPCCPAEIMSIFHVYERVP
nr:hypothetical protein GCM10020093_041800 [Planobispora longispora]